jgi:phospholipid/cholesterol/gamma-HCH transport system ATP-binding protein
MMTARAQTRLRPERDAVPASESERRRGRASVDTAASDRRDARPAAAAAAVKLDHVSKSFGARKVLEDVTLEVPPKCGFIILGRSGTGKSVTLRHIIGLVRPDAGHVFVEGDEISALDGPDLANVRKKIGFLFQNAALFDSISVGENVAFPLRRHTKLSDGEIRDRAKQKLDAVGLGKEYDKMPGALSGGMRKRAGLARAMALDPRILLVDEPSAGLDPITADEIDELLLSQKQDAGTTLVVVTHNIPSAKRLGDQLVMLHQGKIVAQGTAEELEESPDDMVRAFMRSRHGG